MVYTYKSQETKIYIPNCYTYCFTLCITYCLTCSPSKIGTNTANFGTNPTFFGTNTANFGTNPTFFGTTVLIFEVLIQA